jgi:hypothetical protein
VLSSAVERRSREWDTDSWRVSAIAFWTSYKDKLKNGDRCFFVFIQLCNYSIGSNFGLFYYILDLLFAIYKYN